MTETEWNTLARVPTIRSADICADEQGLWVDNKAKVFVDETIGVTGDSTPTQ